MTGTPDPAVRRAEPADADAAGRLLHDFNREGKPDGPVNYFYEREF
jgi:hypothetical protein